MQPIVYSSADTGAPQIVMNAGDVNAVIKSCLITGYGSKSAAGWELIAEDLAKNQLIVRSKNPRSIKSVFVINNPSGQRGPTVIGYKDWSEATSSPIYEYGYRHGITNQNAGSMSASNPQKWIIIASDIAVYLFLGHDTLGSFGSVQGFGDCITLSSGQSTSYVMGYVDISNSNSNRVIATVASSDGQLYFARPPYAQEYAGALGTNASSTDNVVNNGIYVFYKLLLYKKSAENKDLHCTLPGLMVSASPLGQIDLPPNLLRVLQIPGVENGIALLEQQTHGYISISLDDWI